jgi:hypothetical protein
LHAACPALEELPEGEAPGARRISPGAEELTAALADAGRQHQASGAQRLPVPPAVGHYDIARSAEKLAALYERIVATSRRAGRRAPLAPYQPRPAASQPKAAASQPKAAASQPKAPVSEPQG